MSDAPIPPAPPVPPAAQAAAGQWQSPATTVAEVADQLMRLRRDSGVSATREAVVNLVVVAPAEEAAGRAVRSIAALGAHHPGRIILLVTRPDAEPGLAGRIEIRESVLEERRFWWEVVELGIGGPACSHLESVVEPLLLHDLRVAVWLAGGTHRLDSPGLVERADLVVVSGERAAQAAPATVAADLMALARSRPVADLAWMATEPARQAVAHLFGPGDRRELLPGGAAGSVPGPLRVAGPPWSARLTAAWLTERLGLDPTATSLTTGEDLAGSLVLDRREDIVVGFEGGKVWPAGTGQAAAPPGSAVATLSGPVPARAAVAHAGLGTARLLSTALTRSGRDIRYEAALAVADRLGR